MPKLFDQGGPPNIHSAKPQPRQEADPSPPRAKGSPDERPSGEPPPRPPCPVHWGMAVRCPCGAAEEARLELEELHRQLHPIELDHDEPSCGAFGPRGYACSHATGHLGQHVAWYGVRAFQRPDGRCRIVAVWPHLPTGTPCGLDRLEM